MLANCFRENILKAGGVENELTRRKSTTMRYRSANGRTTPSLGGFLIKKTGDVATTL